MLSLSETSKIFPQQPQKEQLDFFTVEEESEEEIKIKEETEEINKKEQNFKKIESETKEKKEEIIQEAQEETKTKPETYNINKQKIKEQIQKLKDIELKEEIHEKKDEEKEYKKSISESTKMDFNIFSHIYLNEKKTHLKAVEHPQRIYNAMKIRK